MSRNIADVSKVLQFDVNLIHKGVPRSLCMYFVGRAAGRVDGWEALGRRARSTEKRGNILGHLIELGLTSGHLEVKGHS